MSNADIARRAEIELSFAGVKTAKQLRPYLLSMEYTDEEDGQLDDLQIHIQDRDNAWLQS